MLTKEKLKSALNYDNETGIFTWKISSNRKIKINSIAGCFVNGYIRIVFNKKRYLAHRLAWLYTYGYMPKQQIDHINGNRSDNRICNLREANASQNQYNKKLNLNNTSGVKGVVFDKETKKWRVRITVNKKIISLGYYDNLNDAKTVIENSRIQHHWEFARNE